MKLIASTVGRCVKLFAWEEVRPVHGINSALLASAIAEQFNFQVSPTPPIPTDSVVKFGDGSTVLKGSNIAIQSLVLYSDGFSVDCTNTDDAKAVSDEIFGWAQSDLGYKDFIREPEIHYLSQVTVEFAPEFENLFKGWSRLQGILNGAAQARYGFTHDINVHRVQWRADPHTVVNNTLVSDFWIERKAGEPYAANRWHCHGVLPTDEWLQLLEIIESISVGD